jgi:integrase
LWVRKVGRCGWPDSGIASGGRRPRAAGLDGLRIHDLRHTAVALWIAAGANPKEVAAGPGHTSVSFTLDRYGHLYPDADQALRDRLDALACRLPGAPSAAL